MTPGTMRLAPRERRALLAAPLYRVVGTPAVAVLGLVNTAIIVRETGPEVFGLVALVATVTLLLPFADLGIGATVLSASALLLDPDGRNHATDVIRRSYRVLGAVALVIASAALVVMALDGWGTLVGFTSGPQDRWAITVAACIWALTIPAGLGVRILIGIDRNPLATVILMSCPAFGLAMTCLLWALGAPGIWYAASSLTGLLIGQALGTVLALRISGLRWSAFRRVGDSVSSRRLLAGSGWLFVVALGLPVGLQSGRVILAHLSTPAEVSSYALVAQIYAVAWSVISTAGLAFWPIFVRRRGDRDTTVRMWWLLTATLAVTAAVGAAAMWLLGPLVASILSDGTVEVTATLALAFGLLLICQSVHFPSNVLLTLPSEARWQAMWTMCMAILSIGLASAWAGASGAVGVVLAAAVSILIAQVVPDLIWVPRLVRRRADASDRVALPAAPRQSLPDRRHE